MDRNTDKQFHQFHKLKQQCLDKEDLSRKGSIDEPIRSLVTLINSNSFYYTTSTCSGRISLIEKPHDNPAIKKGGRFLLNCHDEFSFDHFHGQIVTFKEENNTTTCLWLKFEPFILHVQCYNLEKAHILLSAAIGQGCRNSGISLGKNEKYLVAVRSTSSMEVPLHCSNKFELDMNYLRFLHGECTRRLRENLTKLERFESEVKKIFLESYPN